MTNFEDYEFSSDILKQDIPDEVISEAPCPCCGYPLVVEYGMLVCYKCGWSEENEQ